MKSKDFEIISTHVEIKSKYKGSMMLHYAIKRAIKLCNKYNCSATLWFSGEHIEVDQTSNVEEVYNECVHNGVPAKKY